MWPLLLAHSLSAAPPPLPEQLFAATLVVEITVPVRQGKPQWPARALERVLLPAGAEAPKELSLPQVALPACALGQRVTSLALLTKDAAGRWTPLPFALQERGRGTCLDRHSPQLRSALLEAGRWHEERMRAVGVEQLWRAERAALHAENPWLRALAAHFLRAHEAADVIDAEWGAPASEARKAEEAKAALPPPACR